MEKAIAVLESIGLKKDETFLVDEFGLTLTGQFVNDARKALREAGIDHVYVDAEPTWPDDQLDQFNVYRIGLPSEGFNAITITQAIDQVAGYTGTRRWLSYEVTMEGESIEVLLHTSEAERPFLVDTMGQVCRIVASRLFLRLTFDHTTDTWVFFPNTSSLNNLELTIAQTVLDTGLEILQTCGDPEKADAPLDRALVAVGEAINDPTNDIKLGIAMVEIMAMIDRFNLVAEASENKELADSCFRVRTWLTRPSLRSCHA